MQVLRDFLGLMKLYVLMWKELRSLRALERTQTTEGLMEEHDRHSATHYAKVRDLIPVEGEGVWIRSLDGRRFMCLNAMYSAKPLGYRNLPLIAAVAVQQYLFSGSQNRIISSRQPPLLTLLCRITGQDDAILMNTGAEGIDTAVKGCCKWGYEVKKVPDGRAEIIVCKGNFHGRTLNATSMSTTEKYRHHFGPFPLGRVQVPFGDIKALEAAITGNTVAFFIEPIQGEGGINLPTREYLKAVRELCTKHDILLIFDEVQTGFGRTGALFAGEGLYWVHPDGIVLGKALGQDIALSAFAARADVMAVFKPGTHGSTFGGNPIACAAAIKSIEQILADDAALVRNAHEVGEYFLSRLLHTGLKVRGKGLFIGVEIPGCTEAEKVFRLLLKHDLIAGVASGNVIRITPPLNITKREVDYAMVHIIRAFQEAGLLAH